MHNDKTLIPDELGQLDPKQMGEAAYMLANGQGKTSSTRGGNARIAAHWRLLFLSAAGEQTLADLMTQAGHKANAGQEIRLADIEADAGAGMGTFEQLHEFSGPSEFALYLKESASQYYGTVGMDWLHCIVNDSATLPDQIARGMEAFIQSRALPANAHGQVHRVARRFALVATAGELVGYGLTGWNQGEASQAAKTCFTAWLDGFGGTDNHEQRTLPEHVRSFFEAHGKSRFEHSNAPNDQRIQNCVGFY